MVKVKSLLSWHLNSGCVSKVSLFTHYTRHYLDIICLRHKPRVSDPSIGDLEKVLGISLAVRHCGI